MNLLPALQFAAIPSGALFAAGALYIINWVEQSARREHGDELAATVFPASDRRATLMQSRSYHGTGYAWFLDAAI